MDILGIETSCDETAAAVVRNGKHILSNVVTSSLREHQKYGGIIPEIASRHQLELIQTVVEEALIEARTSLQKIKAIAVTRSPGLIGSLLVGISFARALAFSTQKPLLDIDHVKAHLYANFLNQSSRPRLPAIGLVVSGGHTNLFHLKNFHQVNRLGETRDDAAGEAFDKVARILKLGYPGGPVIDRLAQKGENQELHFSSAKLPGTFDFSFSGVKTAVLYYTQQFKKKTLPTEKIAYAFQKSVVSILIEKCIRACQSKNIKTLLIGGGVAANSTLRKELSVEARKHQIKVFCPPINLCMDNAAMIAGMGFHQFKKGSNRIYPDHIDFR